VIKYSLNTFILNREQLGKPVTLLVAKAYFNGSSEVTFYEFWDSQVEHWKLMEYAPATIKSYDSVLRILKEFNKRLDFGDIDVPLLRRFDSFLSAKRGNALNGRFVKHKCLKAVLSQAVNIGYIDKNPYSNGGFKVKSTPGQRKFLSIDEVNQLINANIPENKTHLYRIRDLFLFSCFTGLRFSDVMRLKVEHVKLNKDQPRLEFVVKKTDRPLIIPLSREALRLIERYAQLIPKNQTKLVFPAIANPTINRELKDLMEEAGIDKSISFHCARHTFASNHVEAGTSITHVKDLLGHTNLAQTQIYAKSMESDLFTSMVKLTNMYH
jgi:integrase/recombinase XerD